MRASHLLLILGLGGCTAAAPPEADTHTYVQLPEGRVWYERMGSGTGVPLIVVHGGPGGTSASLKTWEALGDDRVVIRYDQLGTGRSDHVTDTTLFTVDHYVRELQALRDSVGLDEVHLYGRSWGAMLVQAYMGTNPRGVRSVTLSSPLVTTAQWEHDADSLILTLPDSLQRFIAVHEAAGTTNSPQYQAAIDAYYALYLRRKPRTSLIAAASEGVSGNDTIYRYMWGPSEFTSTGTLKQFDGTEWLRGLRVPTLFVTGEFDEATPASTERFSKLVESAEFHIVPDAGHSTENDNPDALLRIVREFLRRVDTAPAPARN